MKFGGTDIKIEVSTKFNWLQKKLWKYLLNIDIEDIKEDEQWKIVEKKIQNRNELSQYGKRKLINYYEQQEKAYKRVLKENEELLEVKVSASAHNRILELEKENEELTISNKEIDKECSRLEEKEVKLISENEHYKDLIHALETYYDITEKDLEECMKNDR